MPKILGRTTRKSDGTIDDDLRDGFADDATVDATAGPIDGLDLNAYAVWYGHNLIGDNGDNTLSGNSSDDFIFGFGGNDTIVGALGDDVMYGGSGNDIIKPGPPSFYWGSDTAFGGPGEDTLDFRATLDPVHLYGEGDNDDIYGGQSDDLIDGGDGSDFLLGEGGNDEIHGADGVDYAYGQDGADELHGGDGGDFLYGNDMIDALYGDGGDDTLDGGAFHDLLVGGAGRDFMTGGSGNDTFRFEIPNGWTDSKTELPDRILDFNAADDTLDMPTAGSFTNYLEAELGGSGFGLTDARNWAESHMGSGDRYAFVTDGFHGYLFADLNGNGTIETGIVLVGLTKASDFGYWDIA